MTCKAPLLEDVDVFAEEENAEVDTREDKIDWESAFISLFMHAIKPKDDIKEEEEDDVSVKTSKKSKRERAKKNPTRGPRFCATRERESRRPLSFNKRTARFESKSARANPRASRCSHLFDFLNFAKRRHKRCCSFACARVFFFCVVRLLCYLVFLWSRLVSLSLFFRVCPKRKKEKKKRIVGTFFSPSIDI